MRLALIFLAGSLLLHNVSFTQAMGQSCTKTLLVQGDSQTVYIPPCENFRSCCSSEEQNITMVSPTPKEVDITPRGNLMNVHVNLKTFDNKKNLEIKINYTYTCTNPGKRRDVCQGSRKGLFQQQMSLTIQVVGVKLELLECPNCLDQHNDKVKTVEGTLMTLRCSTNLNHSLQYWMMFKHDYNASTESRIAYCSPNNPDENKHKTGDAHWSVYRKNNKCILKVEQCNSMDIGTYTCAVIPIDTNNNEALKFMSEQMVVDIESVPPVPPPGHKCDLKYYVIALSIVAGALLCITVIVVITSVCIWYRNKQPDPPIHHPGEQHQEQLRQHDLPGPHQANRPAEGGEVVPLRARRQNGAEPEAQYGSIEQRPRDTCQPEIPKLALGSGSSAASTVSTTSESTRGEHRM